MDAIRARLEAASDPDERRELLRRLAKLYEEQKEDYAAALETTAQLFHDDLERRAGTHGELERLAKVAGAEKRLAEIYATELKKIDGDDDDDAPSWRGAPASCSPASKTANRRSCSTDARWPSSRTACRSSTRSTRSSSRPGATRSASSSIGRRSIIASSPPSA